ncbi:MAG: hypothetical protein ACNS60_02445 [Candidatus Cyclobacteriaceae bacterium M2_1C_046]
MRIRLLAFLAIALIFTQCAPVYVPNTRNIPDLTEKGEVKLSAMFSNNGIGLNTNFMVAENIGIMANGSYADQEYEGDGTKKHEHKFLEAGIGYHYFFGKGNATIYAGHGFGNASATDLNIISEPIFAEGDFQRTFLQPSVAFNLGVFVPSVALRFTRVDFHNYIDDISIDPTRETAYFFEPAFQAGFRLKSFQADLQAGFIGPLTDQTAFDFEFRAFHVAAGLAYRINYSK